MSGNIFAWVGKWIWLLGRPVFMWLLANTKRVRVLVVCGDEILLAKLWLSDGFWMAPGGGVKRKERLDIAARRELCEETGILASEKSFEEVKRVTTRLGFVRYNSIYFVLHLDKKPVHAMRWPEIIALKWFSLDALEHNKTISPETRRIARSLLDDD